MSKDWCTSIVDAVTDLKDDVGYVERGENDVEVISNQCEIPLQTCQTGVSDVAPVNEAKQVDECHRRNDVSAEARHISTMKSVKAPSNDIRSVVKRHLTDQFFA